MSDVLAMGMSVVVGGAITSSYYKSMQSAGQEAERLGGRIADLSARAGAVGEMTRHRVELDRLTQQQGEASGSNARLAWQIAGTQRKFQSAAQRVKSYGMEVAAATREQKRLQVQLAGAKFQQRGRNMQANASGGMGRVRGMALGLTGAAYGVSRLMGRAMDLEKQRFYLRTVVSGSSDAEITGQVARLSKHARELARRTTASESEVLDIQYMLLSAGIQDDSVVDAATEMTHKLAQVTKGDFAQTAQLVGDVWNSMSDSLTGTPEEKVARIGDVLAKTQFSEAVANLGQLGGGLAEAAAGANTMRLPLEQTTVALGLLNTENVKGTQAGTALKAMLLKLPEGMAELRDKGFDVRVERDETGQMDLMATLDQIQSATQHMDVDSRAILLKRFVDEEGLKALGPLLRKLEVYEEKMRRMGDVDGTVEAAYEDWLKTSAARWELLTGQLSQVGDVIARVLLPGVTNVVTVFSQVAFWVSQQLEDWPTFSKVLGIVGDDSLGTDSDPVVVARWRVASRRHDKDGRHHLELDHETALAVHRRVQGRHGRDMVVESRTMEASMRPLHECRGKPNCLRSALMKFVPLQ